MKCFYHSSDLDGHCSGAIVKFRHPECEMIPINYGQIFPWGSIRKGERVFMVDFCLQPFADMVLLNSMCKLHWIDHHKTAIDAAFKVGFLASGGQAIEVGKAGCELVWEYLDPDTYTPPTVHHLGRYDVWDHSDPDTLPFQYGIRMKDTDPDNQELWNTLFTEFPSTFDPNDPDVMLVHSIRDNGQLILEYEALQNEKFCKAFAFETRFEHPIGHLVGICANRGFTNSKLFDSVYDPEKHHLMITFSRLKPPAGAWTVSLYSTRKDIDCGAIAKEFGGGGHKGAAGFQCEDLPFDI